MIKKLYPNGKSKAFNLSYDDGVLQDVRLVNLVNKYGFKATFNLNSALAEAEFEWIHSSGLVVKRLPCNTLRTLYTGHEVASHTRTHPYMENLTEAEILAEMQGDKIALEKLLGIQVSGFAVPFDYYSGLIESCARKCGFEYARTSQESLSFHPSDNFFSWQGTVFHLNSRLDSFLDAFIDTDEELAVFQLIGHSYDLDTEDLWDKTESIFKRITNSEDILPMTHIEIVRYLRAMTKAQISDTHITNNSETTLCFLVNDEVITLSPHQTHKLS
ncbi:MAG: polysaccharide deacetylase family protein [Ruminococcus sp.]|nr:polysaccharide deacetylase family protein [Ruminococcus sp.]